ncbi:MAG: zinc ribbon domain-containing protein [Patescibacteria group bacterium]
MTEKIRCQSCGMPLGEGFFGTNANGSLTQEYCKFCFQLGKFTHPELTIPDMIRMSVKNMVEELHLDEDKAKTLAESFIPQLKRWK